jgi:hypothetical protein
MYNYYRWGHFIPLTNTGGLQFLKGHTFYYDRVHPIYDTDHIAYFSGPFASQDAPDGGYRANKQQIQRVPAYIRNHPVKALSTDIRKVIWLYTWHKVPRSLVNSDPHWDADLKKVVDNPDIHPAPQDILYSIYWVPMLLLFFSGLAASYRYWRQLLPLYVVLVANALVISLTFADTRYRLDVDPYIAIFAAYGLMALLDKLFPLFGKSLPVLYPKQV